MRFLPLLLLAVSIAPAEAWARRPATVERSVQRPAEQTGLVFVANTGLEDVGTLSSSLRHAIAAKQSGHLDEVVWMVYGRAVVILDPTVKAVPSSLRDELDAAAKVGVRIVACAVAMEKYDIDPATIPEVVEVVPNAMAELARLVAAGHAVLRY